MPTDRQATETTDAYCQAQVSGAQASETANAAPTSSDAYVALTSAACGLLADALLATAPENAPLSRTEAETHEKLRALAHPRDPEVQLTAQDPKP